MASRDLVLGIFSFSQTSIGLLGNITLLTVYVHVFISHSLSKKSTDLILIHLTVANTVTLLTQVVPAMIVTFDTENSLGNVGYQIIIFTRRMSRGLSICTTSLLSVFQAITISPSTSCWAKFKPRAPRYILPSFLFFWILHIFIYVKILSVSVSAQNATLLANHSAVKNSPNIFWLNYLNDTASRLTAAVRDLLFVGLMSWSSGYMVMVLYQHRRRLQHIHSTSHSPKSSPETRATQTIVLLVSCFVSFYLINSSINLFVNLFKEKDFWLINIAAFLSTCYPSLCPLVLLSNDPRLPKPCCVMEKVREKINYGICQVLTMCQA
ncbi:vomeronasal 1 receptor ornAnaV1R3067 [Ornithorhynchus anatinus]|uniref:Vomeronasal type-1 receptor n=1 Tax=Ornithorhynchus anatinus TaxID=9258 RepID=F7DYA9_ORNAN|nr:vomeronasal 1 receptor ornAnaV1R3067 [Ornithorhynchus anatinus]